MGVSFSGELAYEIHIPNAMLYNAYLALREAGKQFGMKLFGARAVDSMRMEKGFLHWKSDLLTEFDPFETNLGRFVKMSKTDFIGKSALESRQANGPDKKRVTLEIHTKTTPAHGGASLMDGNRVVGTITSGDWGHRVGMNLAYAFVDPTYSTKGTEMALDLCGQMIGATVIDDCVYDPDYSRMRA